MVQIVRRKDSRVKDLANFAVTDNVPDINFAGFRFQQVPAEHTVVHCMLKSLVQVS